jgi:uncharacterized membrane protein YhiD involved in acid resistance
MPNHHHDHDEVDHDHEVVEHIDAAATLPEREPVRVYGTMPTTILATAGAIVALGAGSPLTALGCATIIVSVSAILELVRARVSPPATDSLDVPITQISRDHDATRHRREAIKRRGRRLARKTKPAPSVS